ncbi:MAG: ATP-dependent DNA helicase RecG, partial [Proteobacteria bacterium]|nr:ATP-dependent DNA helicase RecG [Pseudomonadota bacterium]
MRDESLFYLFSPVSRIRGVGEATARQLTRLLPAATALEGRALPNVRDLLFHLPSGLMDRRFTCPLSQAPEGVIATFVVTVDAHQPAPPGKRGRKAYRVICSNETGTLTLVFFHAQTEYIAQSLPVGAKRVVSGKTEWFDYKLQMTHPDVIAPVEKLAEVQRPEPVYPLTLGLTSRRIMKYVAGALEKTPELAEWIEPDWLAQQQWPAWKTALTQVHNPQTYEDLSPDAPARCRLAYDEMLAMQLHLAMMRRNMVQQTGQRIPENGRLAAA